MGYYPKKLSTTITITLLLVCMLPKAFSSTAPPSAAAAIVIVPLLPSITIGPNVCTLSVDTLGPNSLTLLSRLGLFVLY